MTGSNVTVEDLADKLISFSATQAKVAITSHIRPDGDAIGSALGLYHLLTDQGVDAYILDLGPIPERYAFLIDKERFCQSEQYNPGDYDWLVILDTGDLDRAPGFVTNWNRLVRTINIDHHPTNTAFANINCVVPHASAVAEIITRLACLAGWHISAPAAKALWVGLVTDSGRFAYSCTTAATLHAGAALLASGVNTAEVDQSVFQSTPVVALRIHARAIDKMRLLENARLAVISLSREDFRLCGARMEDAEEVINLPRRIDSVVVAILFTEMEESTPSQPRTKASFRTRAPCDAGTFCKAMGGGGHARAAGCEVTLPLAEATNHITQNVQETWFAV